MPCYAIGNQTALHQHTGHKGKCTGRFGTQSARSFWDHRRIDSSSIRRESSPFLLVLVYLHDMPTISNDDVTSCVWSKYCCHRQNGCTRTPERGFKLCMMASWIQQLQMGRSVVTKGSQFRRLFLVSQLIAGQTPTLRHIQYKITAAESVSWRESHGREIEVLSASQLRKSPRTSVPYSWSQRGGGFAGKATIAHVLMIPKCYLCRSRRVP